MVDHYFTTSDGVKIHYLTQGDQGSWVVLLHGFTDSAQRMWFGTGIADALSPNHRVVAIDHRNHGKSEAPTPRGPGKTEDTIELMALLGIERAHIHGYSMGGAFTARLLALHPEKFITAGFGGSGIMEADPAAREAAAKLDPPVPEGQRMRRPGARPPGAAGQTEGAPRGPRPGGPPPEMQPLPLDLPTLAVPVICINGEYDRPYSKSQRMWRELRTFQNVMLPGKNHFTAIGVGDKIPDDYVRAMAGFINTYDEI